MNYRKLGGTCFNISEIGYGTWQIANDPSMWTGADLVESESCLKEFVNQGGNFIDTAWIYGWSSEYPGRHPSEELVGAFIKKNNFKDKIIVATKIPPKNMKWPAWKGIPVSEVFPADHIEKCVDDSLRSLGLETIDLMQFHVWQDDFIVSEELKEVMQIIAKKGKVRYWGISVNDYQPTNCLEALATGLFSSVQTIFNIFHQKPAQELFPYAAKHNIGIIARVPLDEGGLSGKFTKDTIFAEGDFRSRYFTRERLKELSFHIERLKDICKRHNVGSVAELAFRFILSHPQVSTTIPGMRRMAHLKENMAISEKGVLSESILTELTQEVWERNFYPDVDPSLKNSGYLV